MRPTNIEYKWSYANSSNIEVISEEPFLFASKADHHFIILNELSMTDIRQLYLQFKDLVRKELVKLLCMTGEEFLTFHSLAKKWDFGPDILPSGNCIGFKGVSKNNNKWAYLRPSGILQTTIKLGLVPATDAHNKPRKNFPRFSGGCYAWGLQQNLDVQRKIIRSALNSKNAQLDDVVSMFGQSNWFGCNTIDEIVTQSSERAFWSAITDEFSKIDGEYNGAKTRKAPLKRHSGKPYMVSLFLWWLGTNGHILWPQKISKIKGRFVPKIIFPWISGALHPNQHRELSKAGFNAPKNIKDHHTVAAQTRLILSTNFLQLESYHPELLQYLKAHAEENLYHPFNCLFRSHLAVLGKSYEDYPNVSPYFGGGIRTRNEHFFGAFSWVEAPKRHQLRKFRELFGNPPQKFEEYMTHWSRDLRKIVKEFPVQSKKAVVGALDCWLYYLYSVGGEYAPKTWEDISRERHISSLNNNNNKTFTNFLRRHKIPQSDKSLSNLQKAWALASIKDGFGGKYANPIDLKLDKISGGRSEADARRRQHRFRTHRKALPEDLLKLVVRENRNKTPNGEDFAFARSIQNNRTQRHIFNRTVVDAHADKQETEVFWPAVPIILDYILNLGMRISTALWLDSGEQDEYWIEPNSLSLTPNPTNLGLPGHANGFLRLVRTSEQQDILGCYMPVTKTGPNEVPFLPIQCANYFGKMRDWQIRYNPMKKPVKAERSKIEKDYETIEIPEVMPLFRDPKSRQGHPPTSEVIRSYLSRLLLHIEPMYNEQRKRQLLSQNKSYNYIKLVDQKGKSLWDLHSLRVTIITLLIENGVSPHIVQELANHKSILMTFHYVELNAARTHEALRRGFTRMWKEKLNQAENLGQPEDLARLMNDLFNFRGASDGEEMLKEIFKDKDIHHIEVFSHGICPAGNCDTGGKYFNGRYQKVFRKMACSRCRYRRTGPPFLLGLVNRANRLMVEISETYTSESSLHSEVESLEDAGRPSWRIETKIRRLEDVRYELFEEWVAEIHTIKKALSNTSTHENDSGNQIPTLHTGSQIDSKLQAVHKLQILQDIISNSETFSETEIEGPSSLREKRDEILLEIASQNNAADLFFKLNKETRRTALDMFGNLLSSSLTQQTSEQAHDTIEALISGGLTTPSIRSSIKNICSNPRVEPGSISTSNWRRKKNDT